MAPVVDRLKAEYASTVRFELRNVETDAEGAALAQQFGAQFVPTFVFVAADGTVVNTVVGQVPEDTLRGSLDDLL